MSKRDPSNPYVQTKANDQAVELVQVVIDWYRSHRNQISASEATNVGAAITNILNGTNRV